MTRVLVVDDDKVLREVLHEGLFENGFDVQSRDSAESARLALKEIDFHILISDLYMPDGGGVELINWCVEKFPELKVLAMSGKCLNSKISQLDALRGRGVPTLSKPFTIEGLVELMNNMMNSSYDNTSIRNK